MCLPARADATPQRDSGGDAEHAWHVQLGAPSIVPRKLLHVDGSGAGDGALDFALLVTLAYMMYYLRIAMAEEAFLAGKFGATYSDWTATVPAFVPVLGHPRSS